MIGARGLSFTGGVAKEYKTKLGWGKKIRLVTSRVVLEMLERKCKVETSVGWVLTFSMRTFFNVFIPILRARVGGFSTQR
jgi:hypothetical protein